MSFVKSSDFESITHMNYLNPYIALGGRKPFRACLNYRMLFIIVSLQQAQLIFAEHSFLGTVFPLIRPSFE